MVRFFIRLCGVVLLAAAFVGAVLDGARSIADDALLLTPISAVGMRLFGERYLQLQPSIERNIHPLLWDPVLATVTQWPAAAVAFVLGGVFLVLSRPRPEPIGIRYGR